MLQVADEAGLATAVAHGRSVVLFHATWCPFCETFVPVFHDVCGALGSQRALECVIDDERNPLWRNFRIQVVPSVLFFRDGAVERRLDGRLGVGLSRGQLQDALAALGAG